MVRSFVISIVCALVINTMTAPLVAASAQGVVIEAVQANAPTGLTDEYIVIKNTSDVNVDVTNWRLVYQTASGNPSNVSLDIAASELTHLLLPAQSRETFFSTSLAGRMTPSPNIRNQFIGGMYHTSGTMTLLMADGTVVDRVGWGAAKLVESIAAPSMTGNGALLRSGFDTDNNQADFSVVNDEAVGVLSYGSLLEYDDVCRNLSGIQVVVPTGLVRTTDSNCQAIDICENIAGVQAAVPSGYELVATGCELIDVCPNIDGRQTSTQGYDVVDGLCLEPFVAQQLLLSELLPNPAGVDMGSEFIELYNDDQHDILLDDYHLLVDGKAYDFPSGMMIAPGEFAVFSDTDLGLTLTNASSKPMQLVGRDGTIVHTHEPYINAPEDRAWAWIDAAWQFTDQPTPGAPNQVSVQTDEVSVLGAELISCPDGKFRNPETNRCKTIESTEAGLATCDPGQYRNPETNRCKTYALSAELAPCGDGQYRSETTNRCRSIAATAASSLLPCGEGKFRNPETNRCKTIASTTDGLTPCEEGHERNPDTNRCRKAVATVTDIPAAAFPVETVAETGKALTAWWALGGVTLLGLAYAGWEWRDQVRRGMMRIMKQTSRSK